MTIKRFPTWGDAAHLIDVLDVRPTDGSNPASSAVARSDGRRPVVEGSQMLGQAIVAAGRHAAGRRVVSASMIFLRAADARAAAPVGVGGAQLGPHASPAWPSRCSKGHGAPPRAPCSSTCRPRTSSATPSDPPDVPGPYESEPYDMGVTGRDIRVVDGAYTQRARTRRSGRPSSTPGSASATCPTSPPLHAGLLAQFSGHMSIAAALRPHAGVSQDQAHRTLSMGINASTCRCTAR